MSTEHDDLEPINPETALELYLDHREPELSDSSHRHIGYKRRPFIRWCNEAELDNLNDLTGRLIHEYRVWRLKDGDLSPVTLNSQMSVLRLFLEWAGAIEAVPPHLYEKVLITRIEPEDEVRDEMLDADTAETILEYLSTFHFASRQHVIIALLWETGIRLGSARAIDIADVDLENHSIDIVHRPDHGTPLKN